MPILRVEHQVPDYERWKQTFDSDPMDRAGSGVRRHRVLRAADDPNHVTIDLEFDTTDQAEALLTRLRELWTNVDVVQAPAGRIVEVVEDVQY